MEKRKSIYLKWPGGRTPRMLYGYLGKKNLLYRELMIMQLSVDLSMVQFTHTHTMLLHPLLKNLLASKFCFIFPLFILLKFGCYIPSVILVTQEEGTFPPPPSKPLYLSRVVLL